MPEGYKRVEYRLHESLVQIQDMITLLEFDEALLASIESCKDLIKTKKYNVAVIGEFKRGKSSLINALLGSKILPADATPATATINRITYGIATKVLIQYKDGKEEKIEVSELSEYVMKITPSGEARALKIKEATVFFPTVICQNYIDIIDTPGLNDDESMTKITIDMLDNIDSVIVTIHARSAFSETEKKLVCQLIESEQIHNIIFVVTFIDQLDDDEYEYNEFIAGIEDSIKEKVFKELCSRNVNDATISKAHSIIDDLHIVGVSAKQALESFVTNNKSLLKKSRFEEFNNLLLQTVTAKQLENAVRKTIENIRIVVSQFDSQNQKRLKQINSEEQIIQQSKNTILNYCNNSKKYLDSVFANSFDRFNNVLSKLNPLKNTLISEYIKGLSGIKENTHDEIKKTVNAVTLQCYDLANGTFKTTIIAEINQCFKEDIQKINEYKKSFLIKPLNNLEPSSIEIKDIDEMMLQIVRENLNNAKFSWMISPLPNILNLAECNIIESIIKSVDISVNQYIKTFNNCLLLIRKQWFDQINIESETLKNVNISALNNKSDNVEMKMKAYISNFKVLSENSKIILADCEKVKNEFV